MDAQQRHLGRRVLRLNYRNPRFIAYQVIVSVYMALLIVFTINFIVFFIWLNHMNYRYLMSKFGMDYSPLYAIPLENYSEEAVYEDEDIYNFRAYDNDHYLRPV